MVGEGASSTTVSDEEAEAHGDGTFAAPAPAEAPKNRRRARSAACPRTSHRTGARWGRSTRLTPRELKRPRPSVNIRTVMYSRRTDDG